MTMPHSEAWYELQRAMRRDRLEFKDKVAVGQLVFKYDDSANEWKPYWVVDENDGLYEIIAAEDDERIAGVSAHELGIAVNADGKTYNEFH
jgi:hypothetical protein